MPYVEIQIMQVTAVGSYIGNWMTIQVVEMHDLNIQNAMKQAQRQYPSGTRIRAIEQGSGRVIDIL